MSKNIRELGSYEIVLSDINDERILEKVFTGSKHEAKLLTLELIATTLNACSGYIGHIVFNSKYDAQMPRYKKDGE